VHTPSKPKHTGLKAGDYIAVGWVERLYRDTQQTQVSFAVFRFVGYRI